jgi:hypothetical protein
MLKIKKIIIIIIIIKNTKKIVTNLEIDNSKLEYIFNEIMSLVC